MIRKSATISRHAPSLILLGISLVFCIPRYAAAKEIDIVDKNRASEIIKGEKTKLPLINQATEDSIDNSYDTISATVTSAATWLDSFFDSNRYTAEENKTRAKLKLMAGLENKDEFEFKPRVSIRLHLPGTQNRFNFILTANDDEDFEVDRAGNALNSRDDESTITGALQYFHKQTESMNLSSSAGVSTSYAYAGVRYRGLYDYGSWQGRLTSRFRYYTDDGFESRNQYDIERQVSSNLLFRTTTEANWEEAKNGVPHALIFSLYQVFKIDRAILYEWGNYFHTSPDYQLNDIIFRLRYRQRFYRDWLVVEVAPQVAFPEEYNREFTPGIILKLEAEFGYQSSQQQFNNIFSF